MVDKIRDRRFKAAGALVAHDLIHWQHFSMRSSSFKAVDSDTHALAHAAYDMLLILGHTVDRDRAAAQSRHREATLNSPGE